MSDTSLLGVLQQVIQKNVAAMKLTDVAFGTVVSTGPLSIRIDGLSAPRPAAAFVLTDAVTARTEQVQGGDGGTVTVHEGLAAGDKVVLLRVLHGQRYVVLSKTQ